METNQEFAEKLKILILRWRSQGIKLNTGISDEKIKVLETELGFEFEDHFSHYLSKVNGFVNFDFDEALFCFWPDTRIREENQDGSHPQEAIWFLDHSINLCTYGFHKNDKKIYTHYQTIPGLEFVANSFSEFINIYLEDPHLLLR